MSWLSKTTGIGLGSVRLRLVETRLELGGVLRGRIELELSEPTQGKALLVRVKATQKVMSTHVGRSTFTSGGRRTTRVQPGVSQSHITLWQHEQPLDGTRFYQPGEGIDFMVPLPDQLRDRPQFGDSPLGEFASVLDALKHPARSEPKWTCIAVLQRPMALNLRSRADFVVTRPASAP